MLPWDRYLCTLTIGGGAGGTFTKFQQATGHFCSLYDVYDMLLFILVAVLGGLFGALFNHVVEHLNHWRAHHISKKWHRRMLEVIVLSVVTCSTSVLLPAAYLLWHSDTLLYSTAMTAA